MKERNFALYVSLGIEIRNFIFGGIYEKLKELGNCYIFSCKQSEILENLCNENNLELIYLPIGEVIQNKRNKGEDKFLSARRARLRLSGVKTFQLSSESPNLRFKDYIIGNPIVYSYYEKINRKSVVKHYNSNKLMKYYEKFNITDVILQGYFSPEILTAAITAEMHKINIWVVNWSWKDFYINEYFNFKPKGFFTWSNTFKDLYVRFNDNLNSNNVHVIGNISYEKMINKTDARRPDFYLKKYGLPTNAKIIIYTLLNPTVYKNEEDIIVKLLESIKMPNDLFLFIKPNPMDNNWSRFYDIEKRYKQVRIMENLWVFNKANNFNMISNEGVREWEDILNYCIATINVPSTVTIESLLCKKPVINPLYDETDSNNKEFSRLYNSSFYKLVKDRNDVIATYNVNETIKVIENIYKGKININESLDGICLVGNSLQMFIDIVKE
jgi:hypothetical protein